MVVGAVEGKPVTELSRGPSRAVDEGSGMTRSRTICACRAAALIEGERGHLICRRARWLRCDREANGNKSVVSGVAGRINASHVIGVAGSIGQAGNRSGMIWSRLWS